MNQRVTPVSAADLVQIRNEARATMPMDPDVNAFAIQPTNQQQQGQQFPMPLPSQPLPFQQTFPPPQQFAPQPPMQQQVVQHQQQQPPQQMQTAQTVPIVNSFQGGISYQPQQTQPSSGREIVPLPDGRQLEMGPPLTATQLIQSKIIGSDYTPGKALLVRALMYVRGIGGRPVNMPKDEFDAQALMNELGDIGVEYAISGLILHWPPVTPAMLPEAKKNLR